jgi:putative membrane protein
MNLPIPWIITLVAVTQLGFGWAPSADRFTWAMENIPVWIGGIIIGFTWKKFPLSKFCLCLLAFHALILAVGGHYTYAKVPLGDWVQDALHLARNHYDRFGHFVQGLVPAILIREILIRKLRLANAPAAVLSVSCCLAFSALYELIEWWTAILTGEGAVAFLGTQGDIWDTQWDMFLALVGAIVAVIFLAKPHDLSMAKLSPPAPSPQRSP